MSVAVVLLMAGACARDDGQNISEVEGTRTLGACLAEQYEEYLRQIDGYLTGSYGLRQDTDEALNLARNGPDLAWRMCGG